MSRWILPGEWAFDVLLSFFPSPVTSLSQQTTVDAGAMSLSLPRGYCCVVAVVLGHVCCEQGMLPHGKEQGAAEFGELF